MAAKVTIRDVAREAGVSVSTVSYVLNRREEPTRASHRRVLETAQRMGYVPDAAARSLVSGRKNTLCVVLPPEALETVPALSAALAARGCWLSLYLRQSGDEPELSRLLADAKADGVLWVSGTSNPLTPALEQLLTARALPLHKVPSTDAATVCAAADLLLRTRDQTEKRGT